MWVWGYGYKTVKGNYLFKSENCIATTLLYNLCTTFMVSILDKENSS